MTLLKKLKGWTIYDFKLINTQTWTTNKQILLEQEYDYWKSLNQKEKYLLKTMHSKNLSLRSALLLWCEAILQLSWKSLKVLEICGTPSWYKIQVFQMWFSVQSHHVVLKDLNPHSWLCHAQPGQPLTDPFYVFLHPVMGPVASTIEQHRQLLLFPGEGFNGGVM